MLYCPKCRSLCPQGALKCPRCREKRLRPPAPEDWVLLTAAGLYMAGQLKEGLDQSGIPCRMEELGHSAAAFYDSQAMPTDQRIYVPFKSLSEAQALAARLEGPEEEDPEPPPPTAKGIAGEILSIVAFLALVMLAVFGADAVANWLKSFFP